MSIVTIVTFTAAEGQYENLEQTLKAILPDTAARPGAEVIRFVQLAILKREYLPFMSSGTASKANKRIEHGVPRIAIQQN